MKHWVMGVAGGRRTRWGPGISGGVEGGGWEQGEGGLRKGTLRFKR